MRYMVTGAAGFIGSHLCERLIRDGHSVLAIDCFTDYYARELKESNLQGFRGHSLCEFVEADLNELSLPDLFRECDGVFHLSAQAGVRASWGKSFDHYLHHNIRATQRVLEAAREVPGKRIVYASSSSVYGDTDELPARENSLARPRSPYGVTKLSCERLADLYLMNYGVDAVGLRYFTVYGPRQRPDMAFHRFIRSLLLDEEIVVYGDGKQTRDFTYISDIVEGTVRCMEHGIAGRCYNIGGGHRVVLLDAINALAEMAGKTPRIRHEESQKGDVRDTLADTSLLHKEVGFAPKTPFADGLREQVEWERNLYL
ncbi:MAG: NAD-dependent epimerase/dehydratase family protein [bacterium]